MKLRSLSFVAIASVAIMGFQGSEAKLTRTFAIGSKDVYTMSYKSKTSVEIPTGNQDFDVNGSNLYTIAYKSAKEKGCEIEMVTSEMKVESDSPMGNMADGLPKEMSMIGTLDDRNRLTDLKAGKGMDPMMQMMMSSTSMSASGFFTEFPENAIKIGDTWQISVGLASAGVSPDTKLTAKLESEKDNYWVVRVTGTVPMKMDLSQAAEQTGGMEMSMSMTMGMDYGIRIEKTTGRTLSLSGKITTDMKMELPSMGMSFPGKGTAEVSAKLKQ